MSDSSAPRGQGRAHLPEAGALAARDIGRPGPDHAPLPAGPGRVTESRDPGIQEHGTGPDDCWFLAGCCWPAGCDAENKCIGREMA